MIEDRNRPVATNATSGGVNSEHVSAAYPLESTRNNRHMLGLQRTLEMSDVGVFEYNSNGKLVAANNSWFNLSGHHRIVNPDDERSFMDYVYEEDSEAVLNAWNQLCTEHKPVTFEMRWKFQESDTISAEERALGGKWVLAACVPLLENGMLLGISGMTTG